MTSPSPEGRARISAFHKARWADPEWREYLIAVRAASRARSQLRGKNPHSRAGIPTGMNKTQAMWFRRQAKREATMTMKKLDAAGVLDDADEQAREALHTGLTIMRNVAMNARERLAAAKMVLEYTKAKPAQKTELTLNKAEEWLAAVTQDNEQATDKGDAGDAQASS